jgi:hypothetical protein
MRRPARSGADRVFVYMGKLAQAIIPQDREIDKSEVVSEK